MQHRLAILGQAETLLYHATGPHHGARTATTEWFRAILRHSTIMALDIYSPDATAEMTRRIRASYAADNVGSIEIRVMPLGAFSLHADSYDVLHLPWGPHFLPAACDMRTIANAHTPITATHHSLAEPIAINALLVGWPRLAPQDRLIATSPTAEAALRRYVPTRSDDSGAQLISIPIGVDVSRFTPGDPLQARAMLRLPLGGVHLLSVGRISLFDKGDPSVLFHAAKRLLEGGVDVRITLVGDDPYGHALRFQRLASLYGVGHILTIRSDVPDESIPTYYRSADVYVGFQDGLDEAFGISPIEALSTGIPCVSPDWNGIRGTLAPDYGIRIPTVWANVDRTPVSLLAVAPRRMRTFASQSLVIDPAAYSSALADLASDPRRRAAMGVSARRIATSRFDWRVIIREYERVWSSLGRTAGPTHCGPLIGDVFHTYPSSWISPKHTAQMCLGAPPWPDVFREIPELGDDLEAEVIQWTVGQLAYADRPITLEQLFGKAVDERMVALAVQWLAKHGIIALQEPG